MKPQYKKFLKRLDRMRVRKEMGKAIKENEVTVARAFELSQVLKRDEDNLSNLGKCVSIGLML